MSEFVEETKFQYYAMNKDNLIVYGFDDVNEAKAYCSKNASKKSKKTGYFSITSTTFCT